MLTYPGKRMFDVTRRYMSFGTWRQLISLTFWHWHYKNVIYLGKLFLVTFVGTWVLAFDDIWLVPNFVTDTRQVWRTRENPDLMSLVGTWVLIFDNIWLASNFGNGITKNVISRKTIFDDLRQYMSFGISCHLVGLKFWHKHQTSLTYPGKLMFVVTRRYTSFDLWQHLTSLKFWHWHHKKVIYLGKLFLMTFVSTWVLVFHVIWLVSNFDTNTRQAWRSQENSCLMSLVGARVLIYDNICLASNFGIGITKMWYI